MSIILGRRQFLIGATAALAAAPFSPARAEPDSTGARILAFDNIHTGERLKIAYWAYGQYLPDAMQTIDLFLRDFRNGEVHAIEPKLLDLLSVLQTQLETIEPFEVISAYRSPATNALLCAEYPGVAAKSLHMEGMAIDIRVPHRSLQSLHLVALALGGGGVGYYPQSDFVHMDVGPIRNW